MKRLTKTLTLILITVLLLTLCPFNTIMAEGTSALPTTAGEPTGRESGQGQADKNGAAPNEPATGGGDAVDYSENNLLMASYYSGAPYGYSGTVYTGGTANMAAAYFARWGGPINEGDDPYYNYKQVTGYSPLTHISDILMIPHGDTSNADDIAKIKQAVVDKGAVYISIQYDRDNFWNKDTYSYYMPPTDKQAKNLGHAVAVIGWDDNYSRDKFKAGNQPNGDGAFLVKNSYGTGGDEGNGCFYISYEDKCIGKEFKITQLEDEYYSNTSAVFVAGDTAAESYDHNYQYDPYGYTNSFRFGGEDTQPDYYYLANKFTAGGNETVKAVSFYTNTNNTAYEVYVVTGNTLPSIASLTSPKVGGIQADPGYHTVALSTPTSVTKGQQFTVILKLQSVGAFPICVESQQYYNSTLQKLQLNLSTGSQQSYVYNGGWADLVNSGLGNLCIKAFTVDGTSGGATEPTLGGSTMALQPAPGESTTMPTPGASEPVPGDSAFVPGTSEPAPGGSEVSADESRLAIEVTEQKPIPLPEEPITGGEEADGFVSGVLLDPNSLYHTTDSEPVTGGAVTDATYDLRTVGEVTSVKNQGAVGACWTFAAMASAESTYMKKKGSFIGDVTLSKVPKYLKNTNTAGITVTATALRASDVATYDWDTTQGGGFVTLVPNGTACTVKPVAGAQGVAQVRCIVTYKNASIPLAAADINIVVGDYGTGDGSAASPYTVDSPKDLELLGGFTGSEYRNLNFKQTADIDLSAITNWKPIATYYNGYAFEGNYNGNGYVISGLTINATQPISENTGLGLFNCIENGTVKDVVLSDCSINVAAAQDEGNYIIGGLAARADNAAVQNCLVTGSIKVTLTGSMKTYTYSGGLMGYTINTDLSRCGFTGSIAQTGGTWCDNGGLLSYASGGTVEECFANSTLSSKGQTGGRLTSQSGFIDELQAVTVSDSYAVTTITASGLPATSCGAGMTVLAGGGSFTNCYASAKVTGPATAKGAFFGYYGSDTALSNCYYNLTTKTSMYLNSLGTAAGRLTGLTTQDMQNSGKFSGWDFIGTWASSVFQNGGLPIHKNPIRELGYLFLSSDMPSKIYRGTKLPLTFEPFPSYAPPQAISVNFSPAGAFTLDSSGNLITGTGYRGEVGITLNFPGGSSGGMSMILDDKKADIDQNGTVDAAAAFTQLINFLTGKTTTLNDYYLFDIDRSSGTHYSAQIIDVTLADLLALKQNQVGIREINP